MSDTDTHVCAPVFIEAGEVVCFECGDAYIFKGVYNAEELQACRDELAANGRDPDALVGRLQTLEAALALTEPLMMAVMIRSEPLPGTIQERASALYEFLTAHPEIVTPPAVLRKEGTP